MQNSITDISSHQKQVLVTGGTGFIAGHCILQLLNTGYRVRTSIRSDEFQSIVLAELRNAGAGVDGCLSFSVADLRSDAGWAEAVAGCDYVLHVASPFPFRILQKEKELIDTARLGTLRVLKAARDAGVFRVVITSSFASIGYGHSSTVNLYSEKNWTELNNKPVSAYVKSKTLAEQAAWEFIKKEGGELELSVINPVAVFGPLLGPRLSASVKIMHQLLDGKLKALPRIYFNVVDVRDLADLHLLAMTRPEAKGERFLACSGKCLSIQEAALLLKNKLGAAAKYVPVLVIPNWLVRLSGFFIPAAKQLVTELDRIKITSNEKAMRLLNWMPRNHEAALLSTAESLIGMGLLHRKGRR